MSITTVLFDLDGTLLPMDNDVFTKVYFKLLVQKLAPYGYEQQELVDAIWSGTAAMVKTTVFKPTMMCFGKSLPYRSVKGYLTRKVYLMISMKGGRCEDLSCTSSKGDHCRGA